MANVSYTLNVNGVNYPVSAPSGTPLLWVLRDILGLTGTKYSCGIEKCFACSVMVAGQVEHACVFDATSAVGKPIVTIEGLNAVNPKLQQAWIDEQVPQCGYCQSGMLVAAAGLLKNVPKPTDSDIDSYMTNICACGTYPRVKKAIKRAAGI
ncbi:MAG: (2Fe-2S)-binding protein [Gaiellales bacterium]